MASHKNTGACPRCAELFDRFPGTTDTKLRAWFEALQKEVPSAHISEAGRGKAAQEKAKSGGFSRAGWGQSAHNYGQAIDIFRMVITPGVGGAKASIRTEYAKPWYEANIAPRLEAWLKWYGAPGSTFYELPHIEVADWRQRKERGEIHLVE